METQAQRDGSFSPGFEDHSTFSVLLFSRAQVMRRVSQLEAGLDIAAAEAPPCAPHWRRVGPESTGSRELRALVAVRRRYASPQPRAPPAPRLPKKLGGARPGAGRPRRAPDLPRRPHRRTRPLSASSAPVTAPKAAAAPR